MVPKLTRGGIASILLGLDGTGISFTKIKIGSGALPENYTTLTDLVTPLYTVGLSSYEREDDYVELKGTFTNANVVNAFEWKEVGIYCANPNSTQQNPLPDILYAYGHCDMEGEDTSSATVPKNGVEIFEVQLEYRIYVGEVDDITASLSDSSVYATASDLNDHTNNKNNPHSVTKAQLGLGNVENVSVNNMKPTFTVASTLATISAGDKFSVIVGKVAKAITDLINHIGNKNNPHGITLAQLGAAASSHNHDASNINAGTLGVARGGTGKSSVTSGALLKGNGTSAMSEVTGTGALHATTSGSPTFGTLPLSCGGTGMTSSPSMLTNLGSTTAANVMASSPRPGVTGTLPVGNGGTGQTNLDNVTVGKAKQLNTARKLKVALGSTTDVTFSGASDVTNIPVGGILPQELGGTGTNTLAPAPNTWGVRNTYASTSGLTAGTGNLTTGVIWLQYI